MQDQKEKKYTAVVLRISITQLGVSLVIALALFIQIGFEAAYSALLAGIISTLATIYVGLKFFLGRAGTPREKLASLYVAEVIKILFVVIAFCAIFKFLNVHFLSFISAYMATILVYWFAMVSPVFGVQLRSIGKL